MREPLENRLEGTSAPFTSDKLNELYWEKQMSAPEIAAYVNRLRDSGHEEACGSLYRGGQCCNSIINRWLKKSNIPTRNRSESKKLLLLHPSEAQKRTWEKAVVAMREAAMCSEKQKNQARKHIKKIQRIGAAIKRQSRIWCQCDNGCGKEFWRKPSSYQRHPNHFCSLDCLAKYKSRNASLFNFTLRTATEQHEYQLKKDRGAIA